MALTDKLTAIANAIRSKTGGSAGLSLSDMPSAIAGIPTGVSNVYTSTVTLAKHQSTNVSLCTLPDSVYSHKDDDDFTVVLISTTPGSIIANDDYNLIACNNPNLPQLNGYTIYGKGLRKTSSGIATGQVIYYPPNSTDNKTALGGIGKFWLNNKVLTYKSGGYYLSAGTHKIVVSW